MNQLQQKVILKNTSFNKFKIRQALKKLEPFKVGDVVTVSWKIEDQFGGGEGSHTGPIVEISDWLRLKPTSRSPGHLYLPIVALASVNRTIEKEN